MANDSNYEYPEPLYFRGYTVKTIREINTWEEEVSVTWRDGQPRKIRFAHSDNCILEYEGSRPSRTLQLALVCYFYGPEAAKEDEYRSKRKNKYDVCLVA